MKYYKVTNLWLVEYKTKKGIQYSSNKSLKLALIEAFIKKIW
jgi:hypothetical protein